MSQLQKLEEQATALQDAVLSRIPGEGDNPKDSYKYEILLREQSIGEVRGLRNLKRAIDNEINELREQIKQNEK